MQHELFDKRFVADGHDFFCVSCGAVGVGKGNGVVFIRDDTLLADADAANRRDYLYTTIMELGRQHKVADQFMGKGFYQVPVNAITGSGKSVTMFLIPFYPDAFGETISNLEVRKGDLIRKMVTKITPKQCEDKQCSNV